MSATKSTTSARWSGPLGSHEGERRTKVSPYYRTRRRTSPQSLTDHFVATTILLLQPVREGLAGRVDDCDERETLRVPADALHILPQELVPGTPIMSTAKHNYYQSQTLSQRRECAFR